MELNILPQSWIPTGGGIEAKEKFNILMWPPYFCCSVNHHYNRYSEPITWICKGNYNSFQVTSEINVCYMDRTLKSLII
jgi:hypothetical protein